MSQVELLISFKDSQMMGKCHLANTINPCRQGSMLYYANEKESVKVYVNTSRYEKKNYECLNSVYSFCIFIIA